MPVGLNLAGINHSVAGEHVIPPQEKSKWFNWNSRTTALALAVAGIALTLFAIYAARGTSNNGSENKFDDDSLEEDAVGRNFDFPDADFNCPCPGVDVVQDKALINLVTGNLHSDQPMTVKKCLCYVKSFTFPCESESINVNETRLVAPLPPEFRSEINLLRQSCQFLKE
jgi:hypothetical protein